MNNYKLRLSIHMVAIVIMGNNGLLLTHRNNTDIICHTSNFKTVLSSHISRRFTKVKLLLVAFRRRKGKRILQKYHCVFLIRGFIR